MPFCGEDLHPFFGVCDPFLSGWSPTMCVCLFLHFFLHYSWHCRHQGSVAAVLAAIPHCMGCFRSWAKQGSDSQEAPVSALKSLSGSQVPGMVRGGSTRHGRVAVQWSSLCMAFIHGSTCSSPLSFWGYTARVPWSQWGSQSVLQGGRCWAEVLREWCPGGSCGLQDLLEKHRSCHRPWAWIHHENILPQACLWT